MIVLLYRMARGFSILSASIACALFCVPIFLTSSFASNEVDLSGLSGAVPQKDREPQWLRLDAGLELGDFPVTSGDSRITALRIDPEYFDFVLCNESNGESMATLREWAEKKQLSAAINASMYLPDNRTSTGYMRSGDHINNGKIMDRFGAFFVAGPRKKGLPKAAIIDREQPAWRETLDDYDTVIQNYRMTNANRKILWSAGGPVYAISAVAQDGLGRILFLHSRKPMEAYTFVQEVLHMPLDARTIMYVEGGGQAGMLVNHGGIKRDMGGLHAPSLLVTGNIRAALPNVLGIRPRERAPDNGGK